MINKCICIIHFASFNLFSFVLSLNSVYLLFTDSIVLALVKVPAYINMHMNESNNNKPYS